MDADFERMYNDCYMRVYSFVMTLTRSQHDSEEITQKAFFKAMTTGMKHRGEASEFTWLCSIAKNLFIDECRARRRTQGLPEDADLPGAGECIEDALANEDSAFRVHQALHGLGEPYKEVFQLRVFGELPFRKIGMLFGKTENWARVTYHRARIKLQEALTDRQ